MDRTDVAPSRPSSPAVAAAARSRRSRLHNLTFRFERYAAERLGHLELHQLRTLQRAYGRKRGPELLIFGDSTMFWTMPGEPDLTHIPEMIGREVGPGTRYVSLIGAGYNPRIVMAFLSALPGCPSRPRVVVVPTSSALLAQAWLTHPLFAFDQVAEGVRSAVRTGRTWRTPLYAPGASDWDAYDRRPAHSMVGARRTLGELRLMADSRPTSAGQRDVRDRYLAEYYMAERLEPGGPGPALATELGAALRDLGTYAVGYVAPVNHQRANWLLGTATSDHLARNAEIVAGAFSAGVGDGGAVVNAVFDSPEEEFFDPIHLAHAGRLRLAARIADAVRPRLAGSGG